MRYTQMSPKNLSQAQPIPGKKQVLNEAGGYVFSLDDWKRLESFLILGTIGGAYYVGEQKLTQENIECVKRCLAADYVKTIQMIRDVSVSGRAARQDQAIYALAMAISDSRFDVKECALGVLPKVLRTGTHWFMFAEAMDSLRGWGRVARSSIADHFLNTPLGPLAYQMVKYQQRNGWGNADLLRLSHPKTADPARNALFRWALGLPFDARSVSKNGREFEYGSLPVEELPEIVSDFEKVKSATTEAEVLSVVASGRLPWEAIPSEKRSVAVWRKLLPVMPIMALVRHLGEFTSKQVIVPFGIDLEYVLSRLSDENMLARERYLPHPIQVLNAINIYSAGGAGGLGGRTYDPIQSVVDALDKLFYRTFQSVTPTGKRIHISNDVSGSMHGSKVVATVDKNGKPVYGMDAYQAAAAMSLVLAATEKQVVVTTFDTQCSPLRVSHNSRLDQVINALRNVGGGGTDCSAPIRYSGDMNYPLDAIVILTDEQSWAGQHPSIAIREFRNKSQLQTKLVVVNMCSYGTTITDNDDPLTLRVVGFDTNAPRIIADFIRGGSDGRSEEDS